MLTHPTIDQLRALRLDGMCSRTVVCLRFDDERTWTATRLPRWNSSTVRAVIRAHSSSRSNACGTE